MNTTEKTCKRCLVVKPIALFHKNPSNKDGHWGICASCRSETRDSEHHKRYMRQYRKTDHGKSRLSAGRLAWMRRNPQKKKANQAVNNAIRDGRILKQPCEVCGDTKVDAHHDDYSKPLDVRWLCRKHHLEHHGKQKRSA